MAGRRVPQCSGGLTTALCCLIALICVSAGCSAGRYADPLAVMQDRSRSSVHRLAAAKQAQQQISSEASQRRFAVLLRDLAWAENQPVELRCFALDWLADQYPHEFERELRERVARIEQWQVLEHLFERAAKAGDPAFTIAAIRSYARPSQVYADADRPEYTLIAGLHPGRDVPEVVFEYFIGSIGDATLTEQLEAWTLLNRLVEPGPLRGWLASAPVLTPVVRDLQAALGVLDVLPTTGPSVAWLMYLQSQAQALWQQAAGKVHALSAQQHEGIALRHLAVLAHASEDRFALDRQQLLAQLKHKLADGTHVTREDRIWPNWTESLAASETQLTWADLLTINTLLDYIRTPNARQRFFEQAEVDMADLYSEHGGVIAFTDNEGLAVRSFLPSLRLHDRKFVASPELIEQMYTGLAHYHFHAQAYNNAAFAAPGKGDLAFADRFGAGAVVLTFIDRDTLNVDYYQPAGVVIDLGVIRRP